MLERDNNKKGSPTRHIEDEIIFSTFLKGIEQKEIGETFQYD